MNIWMRPLIGIALLMGFMAGLLNLAAKTQPAETPIEIVEPHPLDSLTADEIRAAVAIVRDSPEVPDDAFFPTIVLRHPPKDVVYKQQTHPREAFVVAFDRSQGRVLEAIVDLKAKTIRSLEKREGAQPALLSDEMGIATELVLAHPAWQAALRKRGLKDEQFAEVLHDPWAAGFTDRDDLDGMRLIRLVPYYRGQSLNPYPRVIEGLSALVNLTKREVVEVLDLENIPIPEKSLDYFDPKQIGELRPPLKPLVTTQPQGANFTRHGQEVRWEKWSLRPTFDPREGLVLQMVSYEGRAILYRASLSEMVVPYADPTGNWKWRNAFDVGEYGMGASLSHVRAGAEVPAHAATLPVIRTNDRGEPNVFENAFAIYEQDAGVLWSHTNYETGDTVTRRGRQLVVHALYTVGNYDYALKWILGQEGVIEVQVELTGVLLVKGVDAKECVACKQQPDKQGKISPRGADRFGSLVAPQIVATHHQHFFNFRLDFDVEGPSNTVREMELAASEESAENSERNAFELHQVELKDESAAQRELAGESHRTWKVINPDRRTGLGHFPGYELLPGVNAIPFAKPEARVRKRAVFADKHLWVTQYHEREQYAAGDYPNLSKGGDGLPRYVENNEPLVNTDVVLWYTMGISHAPRAEEWPIMPVARGGFKLVPHNFFERNPGLDVR